MTLVCLGAAGGGKGEELVMVGSKLCLQQWLAAVWPWVSKGLPEQSSRTGFSCQRGPGLSARCGGDRFQAVSNQSLMASPVTVQLCSVTSLL